MRHLFFAFKQVFRLRWQNVIKIVSLTLGFAVSVALMCKIAWFQSFDNFWQDVENLKVLEIHNSFRSNPGGDKYTECYPGLAPLIATHIASVESATRIWQGDRDFIVQENQFSLRTFYVDTSFFNVLQFKMITGGNPGEILKNNGNVILTKKTATMLFPDGNALGQEIKNESIAFTVSGICEDIPDNCYFFSYFYNSPIQLIRGWDFSSDLYEDDDYVTFLRTEKNTDIQELNKSIDELLTPVYQDLVDKSGLQISFRASNIRNYSHQMMKPLIGVLARAVFVLLIITGLNFALISISSLVSRAKEVGVRKASGARNSGIFSLIIWETAMYVLLAALLAAVLLWGLQPQIDEVFDKFENIFALENLWGVAVVMGALILVAGVLPAWIFARIPVTQVFQRFVSNRLYWKRILLFLQFLGSILTICVVFFIIKQYQSNVNNNYGYEPDKLIWFFPLSQNETQLQTLIREIGTDSRVEAITFSRHPVWNNLERLPVLSDSDATEPIFCSWVYTDSNFFKVLGIEILQGDNNLTAYYETAGNVVVNQEFINRLNIKGNPLGEVFYNFDGKIPYTITGVCQNFQPITEGLNPPMIIIADHTNVSRNVLVRVHEVTTDVVQMIEEKIKQCYPNTVVPEVKTCSDTIYQYYYIWHTASKIGILASICMLLIIAMGILGYVNLDIRRRTKEIAIRRIHGSTAIAIIWRISRELLFIALLAAPIAITLAYLLVIQMQRDFIVKAELSWVLFAGAVFIVVLTIAICTVLQTWRTANANPAKAIKSD
jgi:putative ABC transport system permease protein